MTTTAWLRCVDCGARLPVSVTRIAPNRNDFLVPLGAQCSECGGTRAALIVADVERDHGGTEAAVTGSTAHRPPDGAASVQPAPAAPSPTPAGPSDKWIVDERSGIVAVYRGPKRDCLDGATRDPSVVFARMGSREQDGSWSLEPADANMAQIVCTVLNHADAIDGPAYERGVREAMAWRCGPEGVEWADRFLRTRGEPTARPGPAEGK